MSNNIDKYYELKNKKIFLEDIYNLKNILGIYINGYNDFLNKDIVEVIDIYRNIEVNKFIKNNVLYSIILKINRHEYVNKTIRINRIEKKLTKELCKKYRLNYSKDFVLNVDLYLKNENTGKIEKTYVSNYNYILGEIPIMVGSFLDSNVNNLSPMNNNQIGYFLIKGVAKGMSLLVETTVEKIIINKEPLLAYIILVQNYTKILFKISYNSIDNELYFENNRFEPIKLFDLFYILNYNISDCEKYIRNKNIKDIVLDLIEKNNKKIEENNEYIKDIKKKLDISIFKYFIDHSKSYEEQLNNIFLISEEHKKLYSLKNILFTLLEKIISIKYENKLNIKIPNIDIDSYENKIVRNIGALISEYILFGLKLGIRYIKAGLNNKQGEIENIQKLFKTTLNKIVSKWFGVGNWMNGKKKICYTLEPINKHNIYSNYLRLVIPLSNIDQLKKTPLRELHLTALGRICCIETPHGKTTGLMKHLAIGVKLAPHISVNDNLEIKNKIINILENIKDDNTENKEVNIYYSGLYLDSKKINIKKIYNIFKENKFNNVLPWYITIFYENNNLYILVSEGRILRPLININHKIDNLNFKEWLLLNEDKINNIDKLEEEVKNNLKAKYFSFIEYIDSCEEINSCKIIKLFEDINLNNKEEITHVEYNQNMIFGLAASTIPMINKNNINKTINGVKGIKQAMSNKYLYDAINDTKSFILNSSEYPLIDTSFSKISNIREQIAYGTNCLVAILAYNGNSILDGIVINKGASERNLLSHVFYRTYVFELVENNNIEEIIDEEITNDKYLNGMIRVGQYIDEKEILFYKKIIYKQNNVSSKEEIFSKLYESGEIIFTDITIIKKVKIIKILIRKFSELKIGHKLSSRYGQKGIISNMINEKDSYYSLSGLTPSIFLNPHGLISRMTMAHMYEILYSNIAISKGESQICDSYENKILSPEEIEKELNKAGLQYSHNEKFIHGETGNIIEAKIFKGMLYLSKISQLAEDKILIRNYGKHTILTKQPIGGRIHEGTLRIGEMEKDVLLSYNAANVIEEKMINNSDKIRLYICKSCKKELSIDKEIYKCNYCDKEEIMYIQLSYSFLLFLKEVYSSHIEYILSYTDF